MLIKDMMTPDPYTIGADALASEALAVLYRHDIRRLPVMEDGRLCGILSDRDIKQWMGRSFTAKVPGGEEEMELPVGKLMTRDPLTVLEDAEVREAVELMVAHKISGLPVVDRGDRLVGVISEIDVLRYTLDLIEQVQGKNGSGRGK